VRGPAAKLERYAHGLESGLLTVPEVASAVLNVLADAPDWAGLWVGARWRSGGRSGAATDGSREFLEEHTLPRWAIANVAALKAVLARPEIDPKRVLVVSHSEGGIVAARLAMPDKRGGPRPKTFEGKSLVVFAFERVVKKAK
jgi:pimeloyl-ACP methyl ester carboxylesterase